MRLLDNIIYSFWAYPGKTDHPAENIRRQISGPLGDYLQRFFEYEIRAITISNLCIESNILKRLK